MTALEMQHKKDKEFTDWVEKNQPPPWVVVLFVAYFTFAGIFPYGGNPLASVIFPVSIITLGTTYSMNK